MKKGTRHAKHTIRLMRESHLRRWQRSRDELIEFGKTIIKRVRIYRRSIGMTMAMSAELAGMKLSQWVDFENGYKEKISLFVFVRMCAALNVTPSFFVPTKRFTRKPRATKEMLKRRKKFAIRGKIPEWKFYQKKIIAMREEGMSLPAIKKALDFASDKTVQMALSEEFRERIQQYDRMRAKTKADRIRVNR